jgi:Protein of unknown function (DUF3306)
VADTDSKREATNDGLSLSRWARLKNERSAQKNSESINNEITQSAQVNWAINDKAVIAQDLLATDAPSAVATEEALPSLDSVSLANDFTPFMQAKVPEALKRQALKALFKETHFNTMDGLDTYIDDYTKFEPISPEEMVGLASWKSIMKPLEQVVTPGGYAVDVESEEGKAVLAAREALAREDDVSIPSPAARERVPDRAGEGDGAGEETTVEELSRPDSTALTPTLSRTAGEGAKPEGAIVHPRYGKRVGDFKSDHASLPVEETVAAASIPSATKHLADDPR